MLRRRGAWLAEITRFEQRNGGMIDDHGTDGRRAAHGVGIANIANPTVSIGAQNSYDRLQVPEPNGIGSARLTCG
jgi:hypothetical protein